MSECPSISRSAAISFVFLKKMVANVCLPTLWVSGFSISAIAAISFRFLSIHCLIGLCQFKKRSLLTGASYINNECSKRFRYWDNNRF